MRWKWRRGLLLLLIVLLFLVFIEEHSGGTLFIFLQNRHGEEFIRPITTYRNATDPDSIAIAVIYSGNSFNTEYSLAQRTLQCYAKLFRYPLYFIDIENSASFVEKCPHKDFMFKRHCILANFMTTVSHQWVFFLDGDVGVINPNHLLEQYLPSEQLSLVFYQRIMNQEIMAGSYLVRNDDFSKKFLHDWADYEFKLPNSFHGTDNGAIHSVLADLVTPSDEKYRKLCADYWAKADDYYTLSVHEVCLQLYLKRSTPRRVKILEKGRLSWSRDGWLTDSSWSPKDFLFHGWQLKRKDRLIFGRWHSPLIEGNFDLERCSDPKTAAGLWRYKDSFFHSDIEVDRILSDRISSLQDEFEHIQREIAQHI